MLKNVQNHSCTLKNYRDMNDSLLSSNIDYCNSRGKNMNKSCPHLIQLDWGKSALHCWGCFNHQITLSCHHLTLKSTGKSNKVFRQFLKCYHCQRVSVTVIHELIREEVKTKKFLEILIDDISQFLSYFVLFPHIMVCKCIPYWAL